MSYCNTVEKRLRALYLLRFFQAGADHAEQTIHLQIQITIGGQQGTDRLKSAILS